MKYKARSLKEMNGGFALIEIMLAILVIAIASYGIYSLYNRSERTAFSNQIVNQTNAMANIYAQLYDEGLTETVDSSDALVSLLQNTHQLPQSMFNDSEKTLRNNQGEIDVLSVSPTSFRLVMPVPLNTSIAICQQISQNKYISCENTPDDSNITTLPITISVLGAAS